MPSGHQHLRLWDSQGMRNTLILTKQKSQLTEWLALSFSQIHSVISLLCRFFNPNITWFNTLRISRMQRLCPCLQAQSTSSMHLPVGFELVHAPRARTLLGAKPREWGPVRDPRITLPSQNEALMWTKDQVFGCRQMKSGCSGCHCPQVVLLPLTQHPHLCCTGG